MAVIVAASIFAFDVPSIANCATILREPLFTGIVGMAFGWQIVTIFRFPDSKGRTLVSFTVADLLGMSPLMRPIGVVPIRYNRERPHSSGDGLAREEFPA